MTVTRKRFSSSSCIAPLIEPIAQHSCNTAKAAHVRHESTDTIGQLVDFEYISTYICGTFRDKI